MEKSVEYRSIYVTVRDEAEARKIGQTLVREKMAACVNYFPVQSIYRWQGKIEESGEFSLIAKTRAELVDRIIGRIKELHSYEVPCTVSWIVEKGDPRCLEWIKESTEQV